MKSIAILCLVLLSGCGLIEEEKLPSGEHHYFCATYCRNMEKPPRGKLDTTIHEADSYEVISLKCAGAYIYGIEDKAEQKDIDRLISLYDDLPTAREQNEYWRCAVQTYWQLKISRFTKEAWL